MFCFRNERKLLCSLCPFMGGAPEFIHSLLILTRIFGVLVNRMHIVHYFLFLFFLLILTADDENIYMSSVCVCILFSLILLFFICFVDRLFWRRCCSFAFSFGLMKQRHNDSIHANQKQPRKKPQQHQQQQQRQQVSILWKTDHV